MWFALLLDFQAAFDYLHPASSPETSSEDTHTSSSAGSGTSETSSVDLNFLGPEQPTPDGFLPTFKIIGDNIDKEVKPRDMRSDHQTRSLHYFHAYALRDQLNLDKCDDSASALDLSSIDLRLLFPSKDDNTEIRKNMCILMARTLKKHVPYFAKFGEGLERHITHKFSDEMSRKSTVVPLGVLL
jgi:L1 cell adhesion molecule like protein